MRLCRVTGSVVATRKHERLRRSNLLLVQPVGLDGAPIHGAAEETALDPHLDAGEGDLVLTAKQGTVVQQLFDAGLGDTEQRTPANVIIVAIVDDMALRD